MGMVRAVLLLLPLWVSVLYNVNMASHALTRPDNKATQEVTTALIHLSKTSSQQLASGGSSKHPLKTPARMSASPDKAGSLHTGEELARARRETQAKAPGRSSAESATGEGGQEGRRQDQAPASRSQYSGTWQITSSEQTTGSEQISIIKMASRGPKTSVARGSFSSRQVSDPKEQFNPKETFSGEQPSSSKIFTAIHISHDQRICGLRSTSHFKNHSYSRKNTHEIHKRNAEVPKGSYPNQASRSEQTLYPNGESVSEQGSTLKLTPSTTGNKYSSVKPISGATESVPTKQTTVSKPTHTSPEVTTTSANPNIKQKLFSTVVPASATPDFSDQTVFAVKFETEGFSTVGLGEAIAVGEESWWEDGGDSSLCQQPLTSCVRNGTSWCGHVDPLSCSCDVNCKVYGDCCADFAHVCPLLANKATSRHKRHHEARVVCPAFTNHLFVCSVITKKKNPEIVTSYCGLEKWMFGLGRPVTDPKTGISYVGVSNSSGYSLLPWEVEVFFLHGDDFDLNDADAIRRELQAMDKVVMVAHPPQGVQGRPCVSDVTRSCSSPNQQMRQACQTLTSYVRHPATSEVFANKFCVACHGLDSCEALNASAWKHPAAPSSISAVLLKEIVKGEVTFSKLKRVNVDPSSHVKWKELVCQMLSFFVTECTFRSCIPNHELQGGSCVHVNRSVSVLVFISHNLTRTASTADVSPGLSVPQLGLSHSSVFLDVISKLTSQALPDVTSGTTQVIASPDPLWDLLVLQTFWSRLSDRQVFVAVETLTSTASRAMMRESLEVRGLLGRVSLCLRVSSAENDTACQQESFSIQVSEAGTAHSGVAASQAACWASVSVVVWPSLALAVLFWQCSPAAVVSSLQVAARAGV